jgi:hypothetical protein
MGVMSPTATVLVSFRRHRLAGTRLFVFLLLVVAGERRLSEVHFNLRSAAASVESADALDGDEIRVRLIVLNDDKPPSLPAVRGVLVSKVAHASVPHVDCIPLGHPAPRGPPASAPSAA